MEVIMDEQEIQEQAMVLRSEIERFQVVDQETYNLANSFGVKIKQGLKLIAEYCDPIIEATNKAHKAAIEQKKKLSAPFEEAKRIIDQKQIAWWRKEQERVAEERRKAEAEARKKAEDLRLEQAKKLQDAGLVKEAEETLDVPITVKKVEVSEPVRAGGETYRETWSAEVTDLLALVKAVAAGAVSLNVIEANMPALNALARETKGEAVVPGVKFVKNCTIVRKY